MVLIMFKQKTAYEMRISDWSSYVCSSYLPAISGPDDHGVSNPARSRHGLRRLSHASRTASPRPHPGARRSLSYRDAASRNLWNPDRKNTLFRGGTRYRPSRLYRHGGTRPLPDARRGHRMIQAPALPTWAAIIVGLLVFGGAAITLLGAAGLLRLHRF